MSPVDNSDTYVDPFDREAVARAQKQAEQRTQEDALAQTGREAALVMLAFMQTLEGGTLTHEEILYLTAQVWRAS